ncbi:hypothetical protein C8J57DRAFT_1042339 [Mycena rebaudengoi]|nr:hypothetical protein C8J57DRAFT_1042339 [Mycena rebaudengoi]
MRGGPEYSRRWFPWEDQITCTLNVLMHLPRSVFSQRQLDLFLWLLKINNVDDVPSVKSMQELNAMLQKLCGIESIAYDGALGHKYYVNNLAQIIAQEMSNPKVRPHLQFYPEDTGKMLEEARQGKRWLEEIPSEQTTPMARIGTQDYFIHEPIMLTDGTCCVPIRWFMRGQKLVAKCWGLEVLVTDAGQKWRVVEVESEVGQDRFMKNLPDLQCDFQQYGLPDPSSITHTFNPINGRTSPWTFTDPAVGNRWRVLAKGSRVVAFPMWLYCDDTSGNLSKKWNEHNSFLFTSVGLPREQSQKEYNIHFLSTSNLAPPLEMLDGILDQLEETQEHGIWAWDSGLAELVLVIPMVLALLGDNPMQSEFACHIGLRGKYFCRACWVKGTDKDDDPIGSKDAPLPGETSDGENQVETDTSSQASETSDDVSATTTQKTKGGRGRKIKESLAQMIAHAKNFVKIGKLRNKKETTAQLRSFFDKASTLNTKTKVKAMRTGSGIKDTFQLVFLEKLFDSYKGKSGKKQKEAALKATLDSLPEVTTSPIWRIKGLDPHTDTPVEILHVILLGFVKYLWQDLVQNQLKNNAEQKALLETRLNSFDVKGLGISPLAGHTLVQYSGSLTGRDFRAIAQAAPFVVYDLVSKDCLATWVALSKLIPLIWQPKIEDIDAHIALVTAEIDHFLICAARWTTRWFNKPKFHIFLHLPEHICRFGPAILFATEAFESFNVIIRAKSVHSNRHAPSRDIACAFAQGNHIRHLLSGGLFMKPAVPVDIPSGPSSALARGSSQLSRNRNDWTSAGPGPLSLVSAQIHFAQTLTGQKLPHSLSNPANTLFKTSKALYLNNGDLCNVQQFVIARRPNHHETFVARVSEILQIEGSVEALAQRPSGILLQSALVGLTAAGEAYEMPTVVLQNQWSLAQMADILCTINVQHNCEVHKCGPTGFQHVYQERELTQHTRAVIAHVGEPEDFILNTAQMRDAVDVQRFRIASPYLDADTVITSSILAEHEAKKELAIDNAGVSRARGRGRGRGRADGLARATLQRLVQLQAGSSRID